MQDPKPKRKENRSLLDQIAKEMCIVCGRTPCDPCHIYSRGSGGPDTRWNVVPMCRQHHIEQHTSGWPEMWRKYLVVRMKLSGLSWNLQNNTLIYIGD